MPATTPENDRAPDDLDAALDQDAAPDEGAEPDTAGADEETATDVDGVPASGADAAARTVLDGPALENDEMRRGTADLQSSEGKIAEAREFASEVANKTEPGPAARPGDES